MMRWQASGWVWAHVTDCSDSVESSRSVATPSGKMGIIAAVAAAAVAGGPANAAVYVAGGVPLYVCVCGDGVVLTASQKSSDKRETRYKSSKMENGTENKGHPVLQRLSLALTLNSADSCTENLLRSYRISRSMERLRNAGGNERSGGVCNLGVSGV